MATYKGSIVFGSGTFNVGWTEVWYTAADDHATALTQFNSYVVARRGVLTEDFYVDAIRVSDVAIKRDLLLAKLGPVVGVGLIDTSAHVSAGPFDALLMTKLTGAVNQYHPTGKLYLRGVPEDIFTGRAYNGAVYFAALLTTLNDEFGDGFNLLMRSQHVPATVPVTYDYTGVTEMVPERRTSHRVGRPFDPLRGRRLIA